MREELESEIAELRQEYRGLTRLREKENGVVVSGALPFEASTERTERARVKIVGSFPSSSVIGCEP